MPFDAPKTGFGRSYPISIVPYDPAWPERFEAEARRIRTALGAVAKRIDHIGSTAVRGLAGKPVIDIQVSVASLQPVDDYRIPLERLGYEYRHDPDTPEHEYFFRDVNGVRAYQSHVCSAGSRWERAHLAFRDHLRAHADVPPRTSR
ncbi:MAG: GrpB family protein [Actinomycetota bacterium]